MGFRDLIGDSVPSVLQECNRLALWLRHFDVDFYRTHGHDNGKADLINMRADELYRHFIGTGWREGRSYNRILHDFFDPVFYMQYYPSLGLANAREAVRHWMYEGYYERRTPNTVTRDILESGIHLFQFGKVGSKSIESALYAAGYDKLVLHLHWACDLVATYPDCFLSYEEVIALNASKNVRVICGVRDPFERMVSGYFQSNLTGGSSSRAAEEIKNSVIDACSPQLDAILSWFDHRFFKSIDVFAHGFDRSAGYSVIEDGPFQVFLYRLDRLPHLEEELSEFVGLKVKLGRTNCASDKPYAAVYSDVFQSISFPQAVVERITNSRLVRHFFTREQIDRMSKRWSVEG